MSLPELQRATALLIRLPELNRGEALAPFMAGFDLNEKERRQVSGLASDPKVVKFGRSMAGVRWEAMINHVKLSKNYLAPETLWKIYFELFEPASPHVHQVDVSPRFFDFLLNDGGAQEILKTEGPPFVNDILRFERAQTWVWWKVKKKPSLSKQSSLAHAAFEVVNLEHDIIDLLNQLTEAPDVPPPAPTQRTNVVLILPQPETKDCRFFEIDRELAEFLITQLETTPPARPLPDCYETLVSLGLCKSV